MRTELHCSRCKHCPLHMEVSHENQDLRGQENKSVGGVRDESRAKRASGRNVEKKKE